MKKIICSMVCIFLVSACTIEDTSPYQLEDSLEIENNNLQNLSMKEFEIHNEQIDAIARHYYDFKAENEERIARLDNYTKKKNCDNTVKVPKDYATIQEAVDAVCDNGKVFISSGIYNEYVAVMKPGILIKGMGDVTVNGGFALFESNVKITNLNIDNTTAIAGTSIISVDRRGFEIKHNNIFGSGHIAVYLKHCDDSKIVQNKISGEMESAIYIDAHYWGAASEIIPPTYGDSKNNTIANNTISDIVGTLYVGLDIVLRGNSDHNRVEGNDINNTNGVGIYVWSFTQSDGPDYPTSMDENADNNILKNNTVNNASLVGIALEGKGSNNTVGPNNISDNNGIIGIFLDPESNNNYVFKNTALNNADCDIYNLGIDNAFKINTADCTFGVD